MTFTRVSLVALFALGLACSRETSDKPQAPVRPPRDTPSTSATPRAEGTSDEGETSPSEGATGETYAPLFVGRFDTRDPRGPKASWPGTRILARFEGTAVSVTMSEFAEPWMDGAPSYWDVSIDRGARTPIAMIADNAPHVFPLAKDLTNGPHEVELYKRSETQTGITQFLGFDFHGGKSLPSPERQTRRIEVLGDSFATGFGAEKIDAPETKCPGANHAGVYENFRKSWGALLGERFDAEVHGIVYSGKGITKNIWPTDNDPLRDYYPRADPNPAIANSSPPLFDLSSWIPDVIVMTQGSCDTSGGVGGSAFRDMYRDFVIGQLRARSTHTHIFMGVVGRGARGEVADAARSIIEERRPLGDTRLYAFTVGLPMGDEMLACNGHGTPAWHQRIAGEIEPLIREKLGW